MKRKNPIALLLIGLITLIPMIACEKDDNNDEDNTQNPSSYQRDKFIGNYSIKDTMYNPSAVLYWYEDYVLVVKAHGSDTGKIILSNFHNTGHDITAEVSGNIIVVPSQTYGTSGATLHGTGKIDNSILSYDMTTGGVGDAVDIYGEGPKM